MDLRTLANQHEHLRVLEARGERIDILRVVVPDRYLVSVELVKAGESTKRVEIVIENRNLHWRCVWSLFVQRRPYGVTTTFPKTSRFSIMRRPSIARSSGSAVWMMGFILPCWIKSISACRLSS